MQPEIYKICKNDLLGRYMVANQDIKQGQLIFKEKPTLLGAQIDGPLICFNCCKILAQVKGFCGQCNKALICNAKCKGTFHSTEECAALKSSPIKPSHLTENPEIIYTLRCILLKSYNPESWNRILQLEAHLENRRQTAIWRRHKILVEDSLKKLNFPLEDEEEIVQKICGIIDVNTFEVRQPRENLINDLQIRNPLTQCLRGLYLNAALMAHDCVANTHLAVDDDFVLAVHASVDIAEDEAIYFNYSNALQGNADRQEHLLEGKYFTCTCKRCKDPEELGTNMSTLKCSKCKEGFLLPDSSQKNWICSSCKNSLPDFLVKLTLREAKTKLQQIDNTSIEDLEALLLKFKSSLHSNHYFILQLKQNLIALYSTLAPTTINLTKKIEFCKDLVQVISKIEPGISRLYAIAMYEQNTTAVDLAYKNYRTKSIQAHELLHKLIEAESQMKTVIKYLLYEPRKSPEGYLTQKALKELKILRISISNLQKDMLMLGDNDNLMESINDVPFKSSNKNSSKKDKRSNKNRK